MKIDPNWRKKYHSIRLKFFFTWQYSTYIKVGELLRIKTIPLQLCRWKQISIEGRKISSIMLKLKIQLAILNLYYGKRTHANINNSFATMWMKTNLKWGKIYSIMFNWKFNWRNSTFIMVGEPMRITTFPPLKWENIVWNDERALHASLSILVCMLRHLIISSINVRTQNQLNFALKKQEF